ncbi:winged helix DNA-binding protein [uncultured Ilyobacter sp.]
MVGDKTTVAKTLKKLVRNGYIEEDDENDRRSH